MVFKIGGSGVAMVKSEAEENGDRIKTTWVCEQVHELQTLHGYSGGYSSS